MGDDSAPRTGAGMVTTPDPRLIAAMKRATRESGPSLAEVGRRTGVSHQQLSRFVNGNKTLTLVTAAKLFDRLGLEVVVPDRSPLLDPSPAATPPPHKPA